MHGQQNIKICHTLLLRFDAPSRTEDPCLSVGSHSAAAFPVLFFFITVVKIGTVKSNTTCCIKSFICPTNAHKLL